MRKVIQPTKVTKKNESPNYYNQTTQIFAVKSLFI